MQQYQEMFKSVKNYKLERRCMMYNFFIKFQIWNSVTHQTFYSNYLGGIAQGFVFESSLYKTQPLRDFFNQKFLKGTHYRSILIGATDVNSAEYVRFDETYKGADFVNAMMASTAISMLFPYQQFEGRTLFSGSNSNSLELGDIITHCRNKGFTEENIVIDVFMTTDATL